MPEAHPIRPGGANADPQFVQQVAGYIQEKPGQDRKIVCGIKARGGKSQIGQEIPGKFSAEKGLSDEQ